MVTLTLAGTVMSSHMKKKSMLYKLVIILHLGSIVKKVQLSGGFQVLKFLTHHIYAIFLLRHLKDILCYLPLSVFTLQYPEIPYLLLYRGFQKGQGDGMHATICQHVIFRFIPHEFSSLYKFT